MLPQWMKSQVQPAEPVEAASDTEVAPPEIVQAMGMEARVVTKQIKLPSDGVLDDSSRSKIRSAVARHMDEYKLTQKDVAKGVGRASNTVSQVLSDTYNGDVDAVLKQLNGWIEDDERRRRAARPLGFYSTSVFETILFLAKYAKSNGRVRGGSGAAMQDASRIALGFGPAGCGKSIGAAALHADDTSSILIRVDTGLSKRSGLLRTLVIAAGGDPRHNLHLNMEKVGERLRDSGRLLIIDEAHRMDFGSCELIRDLADVCGIPILLLATQEFSARLTGARIGARAGVTNMSYDQFASRVGMQLDLVRGIDGNGGTTRPIYSLGEIMAIFRSNELRLAKAAEEYLQAIACTPGSGMLRTANNVYEKVLRGMRKKAGAIVTLEIMREATRYTLFAKGTEVAEIMQRIERSFEKCRELASEADARAVG